MCVTSVCLFLIAMCFLAGCDKPGVPGKKGLSCTSIRNHSSGEDFLSQLTVDMFSKYSYITAWLRTKSRLQEVTKVNGDSLWM